MTMPSKELNEVCIRCMYFEDCLEDSQLCDNECEKLKKINTKRLIPIE